MGTAGDLRLSLRRLCGGARTLGAHPSLSWEPSKALRLRRRDANRLHVPAELLEKSAPRHSGLSKLKVSPSQLLSRFGRASKVSVARTAAPGLLGTPTGRLDFHLPALACLPYSCVTCGGLDRG